MTKTKDICIDFRCHHPSPADTIINGQEAEIVESYKYLDTIIDNKMTFDRITDMMIFRLRKPARFQADRYLVTFLYKCFIESVSSSFICWYAAANLKQSSLTRVMKVSGKIIGTQQKSLYDKQLLNKAESIISDSTPPPALRTQLPALWFPPQTTLSQNQQT